MTLSPQGLAPVPEPSTDPQSPARGGALAYVRALRPRQWIKNGAVFAPLLFAKGVFKDGLALRSLVAFTAFCLVASGVYVLNDWVDRAKDRLHPEKKKRPIAAGLIGRAGAFLLAAGCWAGAAALAFLDGPAFGATIAAYLVLQVFYSTLLKRMVILDVMLIALGFIIRVVGGAVAIDVEISNWLFLCTLLLAVFLGFAKRRHELSSLQAEAGAHRANLNDYSLPMLDQMMSAVAAATIVAYCLYTVARETIAHVGSDRLKYTVPCVMYGVFRYFFLIHKRNAGGSPERVLLSDVPLMVAILVYLGIAGWALYVS